MKNTICLDPELYRSREEIEMWQEKQRQVKAEEERTKTSRSMVFDLKSNVQRPQAPGGREAVEDEPWNKHKRVLGGICNREIWTEQAEILIRQVRCLIENPKTHLFCL